MKANNGTGNNEERDEWQTPQWLVETLYEQYDIKFDCCAGIMNSIARLYSSGDFQDETEIPSVAWMNPPFSKADVMFSHFFKVVKQGIAIYRCDNMETKIWQDIILRKANWIFIPNKRIAYEGMEGKGSRFPSALIGFNIPKPTGLKGVILEVSGNSSHD